MSEEFEAVFNAFLNNKVPQMWHKKGYNSLKSLGSWIHDLILRIDFVEVIFWSLLFLSTYSQSNWHALLSYTLAKFYVDVC